MTLKEAIDKDNLILNGTYNIGFINPEGRYGETQFDVKSEEELIELWNMFCKKNDFPDIVEYIEEERKLVCPFCHKEFYRSDMEYTRDCHGIPLQLACFGCCQKIMAKGYDGQYYTENDECLDEDY